MGGGDLNSKKSWHPNTMKNQERVWKAEQIAAEEKKRILELQQERAQERDRHELNELARKNTSATNNASDNRLDWMYNKPDKQVQQEDYLLGKAIDKSFDQGDKAEQNEIPAVARRVVGSSMLSSTSDVQVDLARKIREDPLLLVKERERAARAALLNNPVQRKRLAELLRQEQEQKKAQKKKKKTKKADNDLDNILAAKLNALSSSKVDLVKLLDSDDSSDGSSDEEEPKKKKKKKSKKHKSKDKRKDEGKSRSKKLKKHKKCEIDNEESSQESKSHKNSSKRKSSFSDDDLSTKKKHKVHHKINSQESCDSNVKQPHYSKHSKYDQDVDYGKKEEKKYSKEKKKIVGDDDYKRESRTTKNSNHERSKHKNEHTHYQNSIKEDRKINSKVSLSEEEKAAKLAEMAAAGAEREIQRGRRVAAQLAENSAAEKSVMSRGLSRNEARALPDSLESRIHSNRHYIQRDQRHMNENFARR
ncbi:pre-mRNA-splicing factor CWC25 homolog [Zerene cesonia]|uniref:pre-mRNA-splicing factor CWC25 homolog n=1 Tax=Zerene cesonia TaxID=33412 RepID=UPI0018E51B43|nr:pre-mRNA-splicing factor CWC25 homolog [Zerene cesonia]